MQSLQKAISKRNNGCISDKMENYKDNDRKFQRNGSYMQQHLYEHFYSEGYNGFLDSD